MAMNRTYVLPALLLLLALPLTAQARLLDAPKAPPSEPVYEVDPGERPGYTRVMGHWEWTGENFMWSPGHWVADKEGSVWVSDSWSQRGKKWHLTPGHYEADTSAPVTAEAMDAANESRADRADAIVEELKDRPEPVITRSEEMDDVEQQVLNPSKKSAKQTQAATSKVRKVKRVKKVDYKDPKQFPFHRRSSR